jgi:hypothetical protein
MYNRTWTWEISAGVKNRYLSLRNLYQGDQRAKAKKLGERTMLEMVVENEGELLRTWNINSTTSRGLCFEFRRSPKVPLYVRYQTPLCQLLHLRQPCGLPRTVFRIYIILWEPPTLGMFHAISNRLVASSNYHTLFFASSMSSKQPPLTTAFISHLSNSIPKTLHSHSASSWPTISWLHLD